jgi:hypothetical protein
MTNDEFGFLFRRSEGTIDRAAWLRWTAAITLGQGAMALIWIGVSPYTKRDLAVQGLFDTRAFLAFVYLMIFALAILLSQVCQYNLSAKRFRARQLAPEWASLWPLSAFAAGAAFWAQPNLFGLMPEFAPWIALALAFAAVLWTVYELALRGD